MTRLHGGWREHGMLLHSVLGRYSPEHDHPQRSQPWLLDAQCIIHQRATRLRPSSYCDDAESQRQNDCTQVPGNVNITANCTCIYCKLYMHLRTKRFITLCVCYCQTESLSEKLKHGYAKKRFHHSLSCQLMNSPQSTH